VKFAIVHAHSDILTPDSLPRSVRAGTAAGDGATAGSEGSQLEVAALVRSLLQDDQTEIYGQVISAVDRVLLAEVLRHVKGNQVAAAERLGLSRNTLRAKLRNLGLSIEKHVEPETDQIGQ